MDVNLVSARAVGRLNKDLADEIARRRGLLATKGAPNDMTEPFARYDSRGYRTLDVAAGYAAWAPVNDATMDDRLDLPLLGSLASRDWRGIAAAVDLPAAPGGSAAG